MRGAIFAMAMLAAGAAHAEDYTITVTEQQLNTIGKALGKLPFEEVQSTIAAVTAQIGEQQRKHAEVGKGDKLKEKPQ